MYLYGRDSKNKNDEEQRYERSFVGIQEKHDREKYSSMFGLKSLSPSNTENILQSIHRLARRLSIVYRDDRKTIDTQREIEVHRDQ